MKKAMTISYEIDNKLYLNITNKCPCSCTFCIRNNGDNAYGSEPLWLEHEPTIEEIITDLSKRNISSYTEIIFCGFGEPTARFDELVSTAEYLRSLESCPSMRLNTNGLGELVNGKNIADDLCSLFDTISISLNAGTHDEYMKVTRPKYENAFEAMQKFTRDCVENGDADVIMSVVDVISSYEIEEARKLSEKLGATLRIRKYDS